MADLYPGLPATATVATPVPHERLLDLAVRFTHVVMSARASDIAPADVAGRTESALREAATGATFSHAMSLAAESVAPGVRGALSVAGQDEVAALTGELADPQVYTQWADLLGRDVVYIVAMTAVARRAARSGTKPNTKPGTKNHEDGAMF